MIIDASVAFKWLVEEDDSAAAITLLAEDSLLAPSILTFEVGNALWKRIARREMDDPAGAAEALGRLPEMVTLFEDQPLAPRALEIACELNHPIYDCAYLALAEQKDDVLVTADLRFLGKIKGTAFGSLVSSLATF